MALRLGKYVLRERLAVGGMAEVFLATAAGEFGFARRVVVKRLLPHLAARPEVARLFLDEARLLAQLHHPRVVQVLDLGSAGGESYQVLEHLDGVDLGALLARGPLPGEAALRVALAVSEGLAYVHAARGDDGEPLEIAHGDVAPGNVMVTRAGDVKLVDFGVAHWAGHLDAPRGGTTGFVAPEVVAGGAPSRASDLYGLGKLLERLLAGAEVPPLAHALAEALTASDPAQRPRTADEAAGVLNACLREIGSTRTLGQLLRPLLPERRRSRPEKVAATVLLTAPALALDAAVLLGAQVAQAPAQLASFARRSAAHLLATALGGAALLAAGFGLGLWLGWIAPGRLSREVATLLGAERAPAALVLPRASDTPARPLRRTPPLPRRHLRRSHLGRR